MKCEKQREIYLSPDSWLQFHLRAEKQQKGSLWVEKQTQQRDKNLDKGAITIALFISFLFSPLRAVSLDVHFNNSKDKTCALLQFPSLELLSLCIENGKSQVDPLQSHGSLKCAAFLPSCSLALHSTRHQNILFESRFYGQMDNFASFLCTTFISLSWGPQIPLSNWSRRRFSTYKKVMI